MADIVLQANGIVKKYGPFNALNGASFSIERGKIYGFIGQNGAGKTTMIRMIAGLGFPKQGQLSIFNCNKPADLCAARQRIGMIVENPALYSKMTARQNLLIQARLYNVSDENIVDAVLMMVGLGQAGKKKVKNFSLGMKQRLAIGMALVNSPEILILDEPINGLDPVGIVEVRELLQKINREHGTTIIISSHILSELYQLATDYIIIDKGVVVENLSYEQLEEKCQKYIYLQADNVEACEKVLTEKLGITKYKIYPNHIIRVYEYTDNMKAVAEAMLEAKVLVTYFCIKGDSLENYFINLLGGTKVKE